MKTERINNIPSGTTYQGYYWMSDATDPVLVKDAIPEFLSRLDANANPFIIEAQLFDYSNRLSYSVKYVDGSYIAHRQEVKESLKDVEAGKYDHITLKKNYANRMPGLRLCFFQYWKEKPDMLCEGMNVLQPAEMAFVGFESTI